VKKYLRTFANRESLNQAIKVGIVGVFNTVVSFIVCPYNLHVLSDQPQVDV